MTGVTVTIDAIEAYLVNHFKFFFTTITKRRVLRSFPSYLFFSLGPCIISHLWKFETQRQHHSTLRYRLLAGFQNIRHTMKLSDPSNSSIDVYTLRIYAQGTP